uniref:Endonuclease/exonuclease/phosphatase domain-containing protein n=1 Tax=Trichobilharzia regenti TaxID=157069 RepID=A0AA85K8V9_TRIRE|nr:unnamed protein product [Trichobilharzia regenti]
MHEIILLLFSCSIINVECIKIGSFNIQVFGQNKVSKTDVLSILVKILSRYDLIVVQEIRDAKNTAFRHLVDELNRYTKGNYKFVISEKLGRTNSKEQYGVIYKPDLIRIGKMVTFDNKKNLFERPPMAVEVHTTSSECSYSRRYERGLWLSIEKENETDTFTYRHGIRLGYSRSS